MRSSLYILAIIPASLKNAVNTWIHNNLNPGGDDNFTSGLNATGNVNDPVTYYWAILVLTLPEAAQVLKKFCQIANVAPPDWENMTTQQQKSWVASTIASVESATGMILYVSEIDDPWKNPRQALLDNGLKIIANQP